MGISNGNYLLHTYRAYMSKEMSFSFNLIQIKRMTSSHACTQFSTLQSINFYFCEHTPLSWAIGERVIGGWAPSGPFPELCGAMADPAKQHEVKTWRFRHPHETNRVTVVQYCPLSQKLSHWKKIVLHELNSLLCVKARSVENGFIFSTYLLSSEMEGNSRNLCNNKTLKDHFCLSLCISFSVTKVTGFRKCFILTEAALALFLELQTTKVKASYAKCCIYRHTKSVQSLYMKFFVIHY